MNDEVPDPDDIGWSYGIYRSHTHGEFIADVGGFKFDHHERNLATFKHAKDKGFHIWDSKGQRVWLTHEVLSAMKHIADRARGLRDD